MVGLQVVVDRVGLDLADRAVVLHGLLGVHLGDVGAQVEPGVGFVVADFTPVFLNLSVHVLHVSFQLLGAAKGLVTLLTRNPRAEINEL